MDKHGLLFVFRVGTESARIDEGADGMLDLVIQFGVYDVVVLSMRYRQPTFQLVFIDFSHAT